MIVARTDSVDQTRLLGGAVAELSRPGDLVLLSGDPLTVDPANLKDLSVGMTMIKGKVEYCAQGYESLCPLD